MLVALVLLAGIVGTVVVWRVEQGNARDRQETVANTLTEVARTTASNAVAGLGGAAGLVDSEGDVDPESFDAFRRDVGGVSSLGTIVHVPVVEHAEREDFEAALGGPITDLVGDGLSIAPDRERYWPVGRISPPDELTRPLLGLDLAEFELSAEVARTARDTAREAITETVALSPDDTLFFIIRALFDPDDEVDTPQQRRDALVGFVVSVYDGESLGRAIAAEAPDGVWYSVEDGDTVLASSSPAPAGGVLRDLEVGGRQWTVRIEDGRAADHTLSWLLLAVTLVVTAALAYLAWRSSRHEREMARSSTLIGRTADLAQRLAGAADVESVAAVIRRDVPAVFGASAAVLALIDHDAGVARVPGPPGAPAGEPVPPTAEVPLDRIGPLTDPVRLPDIVLSRDRGWSGEDLAAGLDDVPAESVRAAAGVGLEGPDGEVVGAVAVYWTGRERIDASTLAAIRTVAELCEQTLRRAHLTDEVARRAADLAELAEALAGVTVMAEAASVITELGRRPVGASAASIGTVDLDAGVLRTHHGSTVAGPMTKAYSDPPLDAPLALTDAARTGEPVLVADIEQYRQRYPDTDPSHAQMGEGARAGLPLRDNDETIGAVVFAWTTAQRFDDALTSTLSTIAEMAAQTVRRVQLSEAQAEEARHNRDLAHLAQGLAVQAGTEEVIAFLASGVPTSLDAVHAAVGLVQGDGLHRHFSSPLHTAGDDLPARNADVVPLAAHSPLAHAARTGEDVLLGSRAELEGCYPDLVAGWDAAGFAATANLALRDRTGVPVGAMGIAWDHPVTFSKELRDRLSTIVGMASQTLERARLVDVVRASANRKEMLAELARHLSHGRTVGDLVSTVTRHAAAPVEAAYANLGLVEDSERTVTERAGGFVEHQGGHGDEPPGARTLRTQEPVLLRSPAEIAERFPGAVADAMSEGGIAASAHLPLTSAEGMPLGTISFAWRTPRDFDQASLAMMRTIAELCTQTLERTRLGEAEHRLVLSLQHRVVTPLPGADRLAIAQRYRPSVSHVGMGGDWYEGVPLDDGRYALVVGDVAGHGITAVADMIQLRSIIESLVRAGADPGEVFPRASALLMANGQNVTASACLVLVDPASARLTYVVAGHPPPLLRSPAGDVTLLEGARQPLLGIPITRIEPRTVPFEPGSVLATYTDGLIERRQEMIDTSIDRLRRALQAAPGDDVELMADSVVDACLDGRDPDDDVALVLVAHF